MSASCPFFGIPKPGFRPCLYLGAEDFVHFLVHFLEHLLCSAFLSPHFPQHFVVWAPHFLPQQPDGRAVNANKNTKPIANLEIIRAMNHTSQTFQFVNLKARALEARR